MLFTNFLCGGRGREQIFVGEMNIQGKNILYHRNIG